MLSDQHATQLYFPVTFKLRGDTDQTGNPCYNAFLSEGNILSGEFFSVHIIVLCIRALCCAD